MASDKNELELDIAHEQPEPPPKNNKLIIIIAGVTMLLSVFGLMAFFMLSSDGERAQSAPEKSASIQLKLADNTKHAAYISLEEELLAGLTDAQGKRHHLRVAITIMTRNQLLKALVDEHKPLIANDLLALFSAESYEKLLEPAGKKALRDKALLAVREIIKEQSGHADVEAVLFTKFILD